MKIKEILTTPNSTLAEAKESNRGKRLKVHFEWCCKGMEICKQDYNGILKCQHISYDASMHINGEW